MNIATLVSEIEAAADGLPREAGPVPTTRQLAELRDRLVDWRRTVSGEAEGELRDRAIWALLGAERHLRAMLAVGGGDEGPAARLRLEAAVRTLREMLPTLEEPLSPTP